MYLFHKIIFLVVLSIFVINTVPAYSYLEQIDGLDIEITRIDNFPLSKQIVKKYDLYELYILNNSNNTYSIPGYSFDFGIEHSDLKEITVQEIGKISKKFALLNLVTTALFLPIGGFVRNASRSAVSSVSSFKKKGLKVYDSASLLLPDKVYMFYPKEQRVLYFLVDKDLGPPKTIKFICKNEELGLNHVVINNDFTIENIVLEVSGKFKKHNETTTFPVQGRFSNTNNDDEEYYADPIIDGYQ